MQGFKFQLGKTFSPFLYLKHFAKPNLNVVHFKSVLIHELFKLISIVKLEWNIFDRCCF